jgi:hypothetical protein
MNSPSNKNRQKRGRRVIPFFVEFVKFFIAFAAIVAVALLALRVVSAAMQ